MRRASESRVKNENPSREAESRIRVIRVAMSGAAWATAARSHCGGEAGPPAENRMRDSDALSQIRQVVSSGALRQSGSGAQSR